MTMETTRCPKRNQLEKLEIEGQRKTKQRGDIEAHRNLRDNYSVPGRHKETFITIAYFIQK